ncbi:biotin--[acetyl-CoA-carboxylase] ligase [Lutibacter flavus]|uniref:BirA family transcriptional regulator, biotin operon repressor / biotin-[acetyl-CoA-carboxylase] ligase n=1 Tax=Lutibacter flavus TaxID=691689 RepID=A0A238XR80_9FLAO|nr:biotin--[acetyl-CoA-carboxylase] ligase [Lutibacter flavus]SNR61220.1 BirA family transcriptional regulator, biotin operon repressor / biotin-[acetyl-CoA-carboxylase] ligase [Lutibacter flavus]
MNIIKLSAIDSTNLYLKTLVSKNELENFTVVITDHQNSGRGQMGTTWSSERGKNLTFSILISLPSFKIEEQFYLSMAVALGILNVLKKEADCPFWVKWPNDILAVKDKVAGVLIENTIGGTFIKYSIVGIGLNVNQEIFPKDIDNVTSLNNISNRTFVLDDLLSKLLKSIENFVQYIIRKEYLELKRMYIVALYKFEKPTMFKDNLGNVFIGKIIDVSEKGRLIVELENEKIRKFNLKEIKFANR